MAIGYGILLIYVELTAKISRRIVRTVDLQNVISVNLHCLIICWSDAIY